MVNLLIFTNMKYDKERNDDFSDFLANLYIHKIIINLYSKKYRIF